jgi:hypothetical protein
MSDIEFRPAPHGGTPPMCEACGANVPGDEDAVWIHREWHKRLDAIEARQRAKGTHDPDCQLVRAKRDYYAGRMFDFEPNYERDALFAQNPCDCWLSREPS